MIVIIIMVCTIAVCFPNGAETDAIPPPLYRTFFYVIAYSTCRLITWGPEMVDPSPLVAQDLPL